MTVKRFKAILATMEDDEQVVVRGHDHSYREIGGYYREVAEKFSDGDLGEWYPGQKLTKGSKKVKVIVLE